MMGILTRRGLIDIIGRCTQTANLGYLFGLFGNNCWPVYRKHMDLNNVFLGVCRREFWNNSSDDIPPPKKVTVWCSMMHILWFLVNARTENDLHIHIKEAERHLCRTAGLTLPWLFLVVVVVVVVVVEPSLPVSVFDVRDVVSSVVPGFGGSCFFMKSWPATPGKLDHFYKGNQRQKGTVGSRRYKQRMSEISTSIFTLGISCSFRQVPFSFLSPFVRNSEQIYVRVALA